MFSRLMLCSLILSLVLVACFGVVSPGVMARSQAADDAPQVLRVLHASRKPVGLLYSPATLAKLAAGQPADAIPQRIADAIRDQTPIVVMWSLPQSFTDRDPDRPVSYPRPYKLAIVDQGNDPSGPSRIDPIWIQQEATEIRQLDKHTPFEEVGAMAAFSRTAFVRGREVFISSKEYRNSSKQLVEQRISAIIEWDGVR
jgi:hypothetical protein